MANGDPKCPTCGAYNCRGHQWPMTPPDRPAPITEKVIPATRDHLGQEPVPEDQNAAGNAPARPAHIDKGSGFTHSEPVEACPCQPRPAPQPAPDLDALVKRLLNERLSPKEAFSLDPLRVEAADAITSLRERVATLEAERDNWKQQAELNRLAIYEEVLKKNRAVFDVQEELGRKLEAAEAALAKVRGETIEECARIADAAELDIRDDAPSTGNAIRALNGGTK